MTKFKQFKAIQKKRAEIIRHNKRLVRSSDQMHAMIDQDSLLSHRNDSQTDDHSEMHHMFSMWKLHNNLRVAKTNYRLNHIAWSLAKKRLTNDQQAKDYYSERIESNCKHPLSDEQWKIILMMRDRMFCAYDQHKQMQCIKRNEELKTKMQPLRTDGEARIIEVPDMI